ncbi:MAG: hypothetical protein OEV56_03245 [Dehalococcoidia bacterium]|nr:hypothetical protein [Dehalococcoidia bacterium]
MLDRLKDQSEYWQKKCHFMRTNGSPFLFALGVDYPSYTKIPMVYLEKAKEELKRLGFKVYNSKSRDYEYDYRIFYLGPRRKTYGGMRSCTTRRADARAFKIFFQVQSRKYLI